MCVWISNALGYYGFSISFVFEKVEPSSALVHSSCLQGDCCQLQSMYYPKNQAKHMFQTTHST